MNKESKERINNAIKNTNILRDMFIKMCDNYIDSQKKIERAIEYIESYGKLTALWECDKKNLLDILRGEDND